LMIGCVMAIGLFTEAEAQIVEEVIYLKNGSVVRGIIVEQIPNETLRIRTKGGSEFVFKMSEVLKITKELPVVEPPGPGRLPPSSYIKQKDPTMAAILSFLLTGTGQFYVEEYNKAYVHWLIYAVSIGFIVKAVEDNYINIYNNSYDPDDDDGYAAIGGLLWLTNWVVSVVTAPGQARAFNERQQAVSLLEDRLLLESYTGGNAQGAMLSLRF
jgi:hypothetical protein